MLNDRTIGLKWFVKRDNSSVPRDSESQFSTKFCQAYKRLLINTQVQNSQATYTPNCFVAALTRTLHGRFAGWSRIYFLLDLQVMGRDTGPVAPFGIKLPDLSPF